MSKDKSFKKTEEFENAMKQMIGSRKISDDIGYIRIFSFAIPNEFANQVTFYDFINYFLELIHQLPKKGLIIDVRGNGGGIIMAAECLLQFLTPRKITSESFQFISSPLTLELTNTIPELNNWQSALSESFITGSTFSRGFPITTTNQANNLGQQYHGPVLLVTDALCYSATDLFAAGFKDHNIGTILGIDENTGAGGANVWVHSLLRDFLYETKYELKTLPFNLNMRVSIRRNVRVGDHAGTPIEDLGVTPDIKYDMKYKDLMETNAELIKKASERLASKPVKQLDAVLSKQSGSMNIEITTLGLSRVDIYVDGRPILTKDVVDGINELNIETENNSQIEIVGFMGNVIVAKKKFP